MKPNATRAFLITAAACLGALLSPAAVLATDSGSQLSIQGFKPVGQSLFYFNAVEHANDFGLDNKENTGDVGENDGFPDYTEDVLPTLTSDFATLTLANKPRPGLEDTVNLPDLLVTRVRVTFRDRNNQSHEFAPAIDGLAGGVIRIASKTTADVNILLIPMSMKVPENAATPGLRDIFLFGPPALRNAVRTWTVIVDVEAEDELTGNGVSASTNQVVTFRNPMVE